MLSDVQILSIPRLRESDSFRCVALRPDGRVVIEHVDGELQDITPADSSVQLVQLTFIDGAVWGLGSNGELHRLILADTSTWTPDKTISRVAAIGRIENGRLCAVTDRGETFAWVPLIEEGSAATSGQWQLDPVAAKWLGVNKKPRVQSPRFGLKTLLALVTFAALAMSLIPMHLAVKRQHQAVMTLEAQGAEISYAHEFDEDGNAVANPTTPGPKWLRRWLNEHWFVTPTRVKARNVDLDAVSKLTSLRHLELIFGSTFLDFRRLTSLQQLRSLTVDCYPDGVDGLAKLGKLESLTFKDCYLKKTRTERSDKLHLFGAIGQLNRLKKLDIELGRPPKGEERDLTSLGNLVELRELRLFFDNRGYFQYDLSGLANLKQLEVAKLETAKTIKPLAGLTRLRSLELDGRGGALDTKTLSRLTSLESLRINHCPQLESLDWTTNLKQLTSLDIRKNWSPGSVRIDDFSPLKQLRELKELRLSTKDGTTFDVDVLAHTKLTLESVFVGNGDPKGTFPRLDRKRRVLDLTNCNVRDLDGLPIPSDLKRALLGENQIQDIRRIGELSELQVCDLSRNPIVDIGPLSRNPTLVDLRLADCPVEDISPLSDARGLERLDLSGTQVRDLNALMGGNRSPPTYLNLSDTPIVAFDLPKPDPNQRIRVDLSNTPVRDLSRIPNELYHVDLSDTLVDDLSAMENWSRIKTLNLAGSQIRDLSSLPSIPELQTLDLSRTQIKDLSGIERVPNVHSLSLAESQIKDLTPLKKLVELHSLDLSGTPVDNLTPIKNLKRLRTLSLENTGVVDLVQLSRLDSLNTINISNTSIRSLQPISDLNSKHAYDAGIIELDISRTKVPDLNGLKKFTMFNELDMSGTQIASLSGLPTRTFTLRALNCPNLTSIGVDPSVLAQMRDLQIDCTGLEDSYLLGRLPDLRTLTLQNVSPSDNLIWLKDLKRLHTLKLLGPPVELQSIISSVQGISRLQLLVLPKGSQIDAKSKAQVPCLAIHVGEQADESK